MRKGIVSLLALAVFGLLAAESSCMKTDTNVFTTTAVGSESREAWCPPKVWNLLLEAKQCVPYPGKGKNPDAEIRDYLCPRMAKDLSVQDWNDLLDAFAKAPTSDSDMTDNGRLLTRCTVIALCKYIKDRPRLVRLLSYHCVEHVGLEVLEEYLVYAGPGPDPILILNEAYKASRRKEVKEWIAYCCHHAFDPIGIRGDSDDQFMKNWVMWYLNARYLVKPNYEYRRKFGNDENNKSPLFVPR